MDRHHPAETHTQEKSAYSNAGNITQQQTASQPSQSPASLEDETPLLAWQSQAAQSQPKLERYAVVIIAAVVVGIIFALLFKSWFSAIVIILAAIALMVNATRRPPPHAYGIFPGGVQIENRFYDYHELRSFSVLTGSSQPSLELAPSQRFLPRLSLHAEMTVLEQADAILQQYLPREDRHPDLIDQFNRWLNF